MMVCVFVLVKTGSRGAFFAMIAGGLAACFMLVSSWKGRIGMIAGGLAGFGFFAAVVAMGRGFTSMQFRMDYYWAAFRMMLRHPFAGTGWGDFFHDYLGMKLLHNSEAPHSAHNMLLLFGSQTGIAGFLIVTAALLIPWIGGLSLIIKLRNDGKSIWKENDGIFILAILLGCLIFGMDSLLEISYECPAFICIWNVLALILLQKTEEVSEIRMTDHNQSLPSNSSGKPSECFCRSLKKMAGVLLTVVAVFTVWDGWRMGIREARLADLSNAVHAGLMQASQGKTAANGLSSPALSGTGIGGVSPASIQKLLRLALEAG